MTIEMVSFSEKYSQKNFRHFWWC